MAQKVSPHTAKIALIVFRPLFFNGTSIVARNAAGCKARLTWPRQWGYNNYRKGAATSGWPIKNEVLGFYPKNRHFASGGSCFYNNADCDGLAANIKVNVKRMVSPPLRKCGQPPAVVCSALPSVVKQAAFLYYSRNFDGMQEFFAAIRRTLRADMESAPTV